MPEITLEYVKERAAEIRDLHEEALQTVKAASLEKDPTEKAKASAIATALFNRHAAKVRGLWRAVLTTIADAECGDGIGAVDGEVSITTEFGTLLSAIQQLAREAALAEWEKSSYEAFMQRGGAD